jgi:DNA replication protein DnaC
MRERKVKRISETYPMPARLKQKFFKNFVAETETQARALKKMSNGVQCYLFGPYGTGKTHLLAAAVNMKLNQTITAMFVSAPWLFEELRRDIFRNNDTEHKIIDDACSVEYLAIDDLGKEKPTPMVEEKLYMIVDRRLNKELLTSFSSNLPLDDQGNRIDGAIKSRIHEMCEVLCVKGKDYRCADKR